MSRKRGKPPDELTHDSAMAVRMPKALRNEFLEICKQRDVFAADVVRQMIKIFVNKYRVTA